MIIKVLYEDDSGSFAAMNSASVSSAFNMELFKVDTESVSEAIERVKNYFETRKFATIRKIEPVYNVVEL